MQRKPPFHYYERPFKKVPEIALIGRTWFEKAFEGLREHDHDSCMEIMVFNKGKQTYFARQQEFTLSGGDFFLAPPHTRHSTGPLPQSKSRHVWTQVDLGLKRPFLGQAQNEPLRRRLVRLGLTVGKAPAEFQKLLGRIYELAGEPDDPMHVIEAQTLYSLFLIQLVESVEANPERESVPVVYDVIRFMEANVDRAVTVEAMAENAGYSLSGFKSAFRKVTGIAPAEYFLRMKLDKARQLLENSERSITSIGLELGFSSSQYFATAFKRFYLVSPKTYRKKLTG